MNGLWFAVSGFGKQTLPCPSRSSHRPQLLREGNERMPRRFSRSGSDRVGVRAAGITNRVGETRMLNPTARLALSQASSRATLAGEAWRAPGVVARSFLRGLRLLGNR